MSFSFSVPAGPSKDFADTAAKAKAALEASSEGNDYALTQLSSGLADAAIKAGQALVDSVEEGTASGSINGHYATDGKSASTVSVSIAVTPAAPAVAPSV